MGLDVKKILDDLNPSPSLMKWIIVGLVAVIGVIFTWEINKGKSLNDIETLKSNYEILLNKIEELEKNVLITIETELNEKIDEVKIIVFEEINELESDLSSKITLIV